MPIYVYECKGCERVEEKLRSVSKRDDLVSCADCDGDMARAMSKVGRVWGPSRNGQ